MHSNNLADKTVTIDPTWVECEVPEYRSKKWYSACWNDDIELSVVNDILVANKRARNKKAALSFPSIYGIRSYNPYYELPVEGGKIIGRNNGEFGGFVSFVAENDDSYNIINDTFLNYNCCGFYTLGNKMYVLIGQSHLTIDHGFLYEIVYNINKWKAVCKADLGSCPKVFTIVDDKVYIAATNSLLVIADGKLSDILVERSRWCGLYPNSIICANNSLYIGMRGYVFVFNLLTRQETWFRFIDNSEEADNFKDCEWLIKLND